MGHLHDPMSSRRDLAQDDEKFHSGCEHSGVPPAQQGCEETWLVVVSHYASSLPVLRVNYWRPLQLVFLEVLSLISESCFRMYQPSNNALQGDDNMGSYKKDFYMAIRG